MRGRGKRRKKEGKKKKKKKEKKWRFNDLDCCHIFYKKKKIITSFLSILPSSVYYYEGTQRSVGVITIEARVITVQQRYHMAAWQYI